MRLRNPSSAGRILMSASCARPVPRVFKAVYDLVAVGTLPHGWLLAWLASRLVRASKAEATLRSRQDPESIYSICVCWGLPARIQPILRSPRE